MHTAITTTLFRARETRRDQAPAHHPGRGLARLAAGAALAVLLGAAPVAPPLTGAARAAPRTVAPHIARATGLGAPRTLAFEPNRGQDARAVDFLARGHGYTLELAATGATLTASPSVASSPSQATGVRLSLLGGRPGAHGWGQGLLPGTVSYLRGRDPRRWLTRLSTYAVVRYASVYPGVDLVYYGARGHLEYDFRVAPGGDPRQIRWAVAGGALALAPDGDLILRTAAGELRQRRPAVYQFVAGARRAVAGAYTLRGRVVGFRLGAYDRHRPLVIDPVVVYSTYDGGGGEDRGSGVAVDGQGNAYVAGTTTSVYPAQTAFITKLDPSGTRTLWTAYVTNYDAANPGNKACDSQGNGVAVDGQGNAYMTGTYGYAKDFNICFEQAVLWAKVDPSGAVTARFFGNGGGNLGAAIAVDSVGNSYLTGQTDNRPNYFPVTQGAYQTTAGIDKVPSGGVAGDAFVLKVDPSGSEVYGTYLGGSGIDDGRGIAVDGQGNVVVGGTTGGTVNGNSDFPVTANALQKTPGNWAAPSYVAELSADGSSLLYATFLSGNLGEYVSAVAVDGRGDIYATGQTESSDFPTTPNAFKRTCGDDGICHPVNSCYWDWGLAGNVCHIYSAEDAFVTVIDPRRAGVDSLLYSTYLGGAYRDMGYGIAVDAAGAAYVAGRTMSGDFPVRDASQPAFGGNWNAFVSKIDPSRSGDASLVWSTYLGGTGYDEADSLALDAGGNVYVAGYTTSADFPTRNPLQAAGSGKADAFLTKLSQATATTLAALALDPPTLTGGGSATGTVTLTGPAPAGGAAVALASAVPGLVSVPATVTVPAGATSATFTVSVGAASSPTDVTLTATYNGARATATLSDAPVSPSATATNTVVPPSATATNTMVPPIPTGTPTTRPVPPTDTPPAPTATSRVPAPTGTTPPATDTPQPGPPTAVPSATPESYPAPSATAGTGPATPTPASPGCCNRRPPAPGLKLDLVGRPGRVIAGHALNVGLRTAARARVTLTLQVTTTRRVWRGAGKHRRSETRTIILYRVVVVGVADARGRLSARLVVGYRPARPTTALLLAQAHQGRRVATRTARVTIVPPGRR